MSDDELRAAVAKMRTRAQSVGSMSALWEVIFDAEAHLQGTPEKAMLDRQAIEEMVRAHAANEPRP